VSAVGLAGTGRMGSQMARRLAGAGHELVLQNRTLAKAEALAAELGCGVARTPAELARRCELVLVMVGDERAADDVYVGRDGLVSGLGRASLVVEMSTLGPENVLELGRAISRTGARLIDAPVSGTPAAAGAGELLIMVGGDPEDASRATPVLESLAGSLVHLGPLGSGSVMKLVVNGLVFGLAEAIAEGLVLAERCGIDREAAYDIFLASAVTNPMMRHRRDLYVRPERAATAFRLVLAEKDLRLIEELARNVGAPMAQVELNRRVISEAIAAGLGEQDLAALAVHLRAQPELPGTGSRA